jgi:SAM-dependent methyltransferase
VAAGLATWVLALLLILLAGLAPLAAWLSFVLPAAGAFLAWTHFSNLAVALEAVPEEVPGNQARVRHHYEREATRYGSPDTEGWFRWVRRRELRALVELADPRPGELALDAGCGAGAVARRLQERGARVIGVDLSPRMLARARPYLEEAVCEDFARFQLPGPVDLAVCAGALEFASDPRAAVHHLARQLRAGGRLVLLVPVAGIAGWYYRRVQGRRGMHVHLFPLGALRRWAGESGLTLRRRAFPFFHCQVLLFRR